MHSFLCRCSLPPEQAQEAHEIVVAAVENKSHIDPPWTGE